METDLGQGMPERTALVALGGNLPSPLGPPEVTLGEAVIRIGRLLGRITGKSRFWRTPCMPAGAGPDYVNAALVCRTRLGPARVLAVLHGIEADLSRERTGRWAARTVDLDLLALDDLVLPDAQVQARWRDLPPDRQRQEAPRQLILPHPRLQDRGFVLAPLAECAPDWRHPALGQTVRQMLQALPPGATADMVPMPG